MQTSFRSVMMSEHCGDPLPGSSFSSFNNDYDDRNIDADNVAILGGGSTPKDTHHEPMTAARQCCFVGSIALCVLAVVGFIWVVPCREDGTCPAVIDRVKSHNWLNNYTRIELKGGVNIVAGPRPWENNLIFMYRGDRFFPEYKATKTQRHGIISLNGSSGAVAWFLEMIDEPLAIDCAQLDADNDGRPECLVIDEYGEIAVLNPLTGQWVWRFMEHSVQRLQHVDFPVMLPDLDGDGVLEILSVGSINLQQRTKAYAARGVVSPLPPGRNMLRIISGRSGHPIADDFQLHDCDAVRKLQLDNQRVTFNCVRNNTELQSFKRLDELVGLITNKSPANHTFARRPPPAAKFRGRPTPAAAAASQRNTYSLSGREMLVENRGHCPDACSVTFVLRTVDAGGGETRVLHNFTKAGMYGMVPAQWHFERTKTSGFVMKFWKWHNVPPAADKGEVPFATEKPPTATGAPPPPPAHNAANASRGERKMQKSNQISKDNNNLTKPNQLAGGKTRKNTAASASRYPGTEHNSFEHYVRKRHTFAVLDPHLPLPPLPPAAPPSEVNLAKRPLAATASAASAGVGTNHVINNYKMQMITETVILVLFVGGDTRIENTSQSNIVQFCRKERGEMLCQPDLRNQDNSLLVADLDQDDSQELVSYSSTFVEGPGGVSADQPDNWNLMTEVRLLRLESELAAFYADIRTN